MPILGAPFGPGDVSFPVPRRGRHALQKHTVFQNRLPVIFPFFSYLVFHQKFGLWLGFLFARLFGCFLAVFVPIFARCDGSMPLRGPQVVRDTRALHRVSGAPRKHNLLSLEQVFARRSA